MPGTDQHHLPVGRRVAGRSLLLATAAGLSALALRTSLALAQEVPAAGPAPDGGDMSGLEVITLALVNGARLHNGVKPLEWDGAMASAARDHAADMMRNAFVRHTGSDGSTPQQRLKRAGVDFRWGSENIWTYWGNVPEEGPRVMHAAMMAEPHSPQLWNHIRNILHDGYRRIGVGIAVNARGVQYLSEKFAD